jgi:hypothetical protein
MTITQERATRTVIPDVDEAWALYVDLFTEVDELAAQRHLMTPAEFADVYADEDVLKFYAVDDKGTPIGMSVLTRRLEAWPLISPRFFARRWPELYQRQAIWYIGFVGVLPKHVHAFRQLVSDMYPFVIGTAGVAVMDFCTYNVTARRLPEVTLRLLGRLNPAAGMHVLDTQSFVLYHFDQPEGA